MAEASDAGSKAEYRVDGKDGDVDFPHGNLKPIYTIGEYDATTGYMPTGVPDGMGAMKLNDVTMRFISQSESYGFLGDAGEEFPTFPMDVNNGAAKFTGSKAYYVDYDIAQMKEFMTHSGPAAPMIRGAGSIIETVVNLKGEQVEARSTVANTPHSKPHYSQTSSLISQASSPNRLWVVSREELQKQLWPSTTRSSLSVSKPMELRAV